MVDVSDGGGSANTARTISVTIHRIEQIAKSVVERAEQDAASSHQGFQDTPVSMSSYGDVPLARDIGEMHRAAHLIFLDTVQGVVDDLKHFQSNLLDSAKAHQDTDDAAYATLSALGRTYEHYSFRSRSNWEKSSRRHWHPGAEDDQRARKQDSGDHRGSGDHAKGSERHGYGS